MKFFYRLEDRSTWKPEDVTHHAYSSAVHGPYYGKTDAQEAMSRIAPNNKAARFLLFDAEICGVLPSKSEKPESEKREPGNESKWERKEDGSWICKECKAPIMSAQVAHSIHDGPFELSGSGQCEYESVGYCPNCEKKPNYHGTPIRRPSRW